MSAPATRSAKADPAGALASAHDDDAKAAQIIAAAAAIVKSANTDPALQVFFDALFDGAPAEDVTHYAPESLAALAMEAFAKSATRKAGETLVTAFGFRAQGPQHTHNETVLIAVNDDKPFLFDSLIAELTANGARVHALFHPIFDVARDENGVRSETGTTIRESTIVAVLEPISDEAQLETLVNGAHDVFAQVRVAVRDWKKWSSLCKRRSAA